MLRRGSIVVASDPYGHTPRRPYLILSDEAHPSSYKEGIPPFTAGGNPTIPELAMFSRSDQMPTDDSILHKNLQ